MELVKLVNYLILLVPTNRFYMCGKNAKVFRELDIIKPINELAKLEGNRKDLIVRSCIEGFANSSENDFLIYYQYTRVM